MKRISSIIIIFGLILSSCSSKSDEFETKIVIPKVDSNFIYIDTLNPRLLLDKFIHDSTALNYTVVWKPQIEDMSTFQYYRSDDSMIYTRIDTSIKVKNINKYPDYQFIFLISDKYDTKNHQYWVFFREIGAVLYKKQNGYCKLFSFRKSVFSSTFLDDDDYKIEIESFSKIADFLKVEDRYNARARRICYYSLEDFHLVFEYALEIVSSDLTYVEEQEMINKEGDCFDIKTTVSEENAPTKTSIKHYIYNAEKKIFE